MNNCLQKRKVPRSTREQHFGRGSIGSQRNGGNGMQDAVEDRCHEATCSHNSGLTACEIKRRALWNRTRPAPEATVLFIPRPSSRTHFTQRNATQRRCSVNVLHARQTTHLRARALVKLSKRRQHNRTAHSPLFTAHQPPTSETLSQSLANFRGNSRSKMLFAILLELKIHTAFSSV